MGFLSRLQQVDRRWVSLVVLVILALPLVIKIDLPIIPLPPTKQLKAYIDGLPKDKLIVIACDWEAGTKGECDPLTTAMMDYLMREGRPFAIFSLIPQGPELAGVIAERLARKHQVRYGEAWINWGYRPNFTTTLIAMMSDLPGTIKTDTRGVDVSTYPMMQGLKSLKDVGLLYNVTGTGILELYIQFCSGTALAQGCTAVVGPELYPYLQSGQIKGLLVGLGGAAQFETLTGFKDEHGAPGGQGSQRMGSQSLGHLLVMLLIIFGNLGAWASERAGAAGTARTGDDDAPIDEEER